ncbi:hypothetical protein Bbelb_251370 [Branchiostoma belcheri]|nr:hypothetical protein Bbelb_251370 [Branchiostoma belcheri]
MAENLPPNTAPKAMVVRNEFFGEGMAKPDTGTVPSTFRQAAEGASHHISGRCEENKDIDDENLSDTSDAAAENSQTIDIGPGEFDVDAYAIAYICNEETIRIKKVAVETKNKLKATKMAPDNSNDDDIHLARRGSIHNETETLTFKANDSNVHTQARDPSPMYTQNMNPQPMDAENDVNLNPMYLRSTMEPNASPGPARNPNPMYTHNATNTSPTHSRNDVNPNPMYMQSTMEPIASPGPTRNPNPMYTQNMNPQPMDAENGFNPNPMYLQSTMEPIASPGPARNPNPMYTHNATNPSPTHYRNDVNPNPMYLQSSPGPTFKSYKSDDNPCTQTSADTHQQAFSRPATNNDDNHCLQPHAVTHLQQDDEAASMKIPEDNEDNPCIQPNAVNHQEDQEPSLNCDDGQPYAVRYQEHDDSGSAASKNRHTASIASEDEVCQPYAAAYMCQGDLERNTASEDTQASLSSQNLPAAASNNINDANDVLHALNPNLMHVPNVQHPAAHGCTRRRVIFAVEAAVILGLFIVAGVFLCLSLSARPPQLPAVSNTPHHKGCDVKPEKIKFGGWGTQPGKFSCISGVAVSADSEIFVTDDKRVQVFSIKGTFLRLFPTVVPGESKKMYPEGVALDVGPGYLWVLGKSLRSNEGHVVQYSKNGQPIKKFDVSVKGYFPVIAMDVRNNKVIVGDKYRIMMFDPNGSRIWSSEVHTKVEISILRTVYGISGVTSDKEGNVLLTDGHKTIQKYNSSGVKIFEFGTYGQGKGQLNSPRGICLDTSGRIIVANNLNHRVDMFTGQGEFVRTIADIKRPRAVAMGPCGELVVTSSFTTTVTIFPRANSASLKP